MDKLSEQTKNKNLKPPVSYPINWFGFWVQNDTFMVENIF